MFLDRSDNGHDGWTVLQLEWSDDELLALPSHCCHHFSPAAATRLPSRHHLQPESRSQVGVG